MPVFRWDIDKTYLETDFESFSGLWRAATEAAHEKVTADGVLPLVHALQVLPDAKMVFLSGSPTQMRSVLLEKFSLDGVDVDDIILKDSLGALTHGRFSDIRNQFGHKLPSLLKHRLTVQTAACAHEEYLFGDDVEQDALIYLTYQLILEGSIGWKKIKKLMTEGGALPGSIERTRLIFQKLEINKQVVKGIFIRLTKHQVPDWMQTLVPHLIPVHSWSQAGIKLLADGVIKKAALHKICLDEGVTPIQFANLVQDLQLRGVLTKEKARSVLHIMGGENRFFFDDEQIHPLTFSRVSNAIQRAS